MCVDGEDWYPEVGKPGDVVTVPAEVKHWHSAKKGSWFSTWRWNALGKILQMNGASRLAIKNIISEVFQNGFRNSY